MAQGKSQRVIDDNKAIIYKELYSKSEMERILVRLYSKYTSRPQQNTSFNYLSFLQFRQLLVDCKALKDQKKLAQQIA